MQLSQLYIIGGDVTGISNTIYYIFLQFVK